ncbi:hypothetical protein AG1IA_06458 [Rhizoctonia solani AG-1 IA]|uniref:Uncharacterized protein n=1 Tax=Thanatephorus cucumeris (strain AG1-IA) TaxID=983506 RepID=L8WS02_THACA|nr:hypothetical protein AG1IA_06458 [Rhizoctonia solani AG-1 IA]
MFVFVFVVFSFLFSFLFALCLLCNYTVSMGSLGCSLPASITMFHVTVYCFK